MLLPDPRRGSPISLHPLPAFLANTRQPVLAYILKAWLLVFLPSVALSVAISLLVQQPAGPEFQATGLKLFLLVALFAPVAETLLMIPPLLLLERLAGARLAIVGSAILWGLLHSLSAPLWGLIAWWPFLILSAIMLVWRRERGLIAATLVVTAVHSLQNAVVVSTLILG